MHAPVNSTSLAIVPSGVSLMTRVGFEPTTYGLKVLFTAKPDSSRLAPPQYEAPTYSSEHDPKRPARDATSCQSPVSVLLSLCEPVKEKKQKKQNGFQGKTTKAFASLTNQRQTPQMHVQPTTGVAGK